jgi:iron(III) transport system substrate-binding protein
MKRVLALAGLWLSMAMIPALAAEPPAVTAAPAAEQDAMRAKIAGARAEGAVAYWDAVIGPETNDAMSKAFRVWYGLDSSFAVHHTQSATLNLVTHVDQEVASGKITTDVASLASPPWLNGLIAAGHLMQYDSPEHVHYTKAFEAGLARRGYYIPNGAYFFTPCWNPDVFDFKGKTWKSVLGAVPPGRISTNDATNSATGLLSYIGLRGLLGEDYFRALAKMKPQFIVRTEQMTERLVTGQDMMAFGDTSGRLMQAVNRGANLKYLIPEEGVVLLGAGSFILAKAPHPNAAKLWLDFMLSDQGQTIMTRLEAVTSVRGGFKSPLPQWAPAIDDMKVVNVDWSSLTTEQIRAARAEWISIMNP